MTKLLQSILATAILATACRGQEPAGPDLQAMADSMLPRLEELGGLPARKPVRVAVQSREEMRAYVERQLDEEFPPDELEGLRAAYAAFGMIPDTLDLRRLLLDVYTEQVVGYYDPDTKQLYVVEGVSPEELRPVMAHELVHALQDQHVDLDSLIAPERGNDRQAAAQAAIEGHATLVMFSWLLEDQSGGAVGAAQLPDLTAQLEPLLETQNDQFPVFRSAPRLIRQTLLFPYVRGAAFARLLWRTAPAGAEGAAAYPAPFGDRLPASTEQVLHPEDRFLAGRDEPSEIEISDRAGTWRTAYSNTLGELETTVLLDQHLGRGAGELARGWDGDRFVLLASPSGDHALVWYSVWDSTAAADRFADAYRRILARRASRHGRVERIEVGGRPVVRVIDAPTAVPLEGIPVPAVTAINEG